MQMKPEISGPAEVTVAREAVWLSVQLAMSFRAALAQKADVI
jgi:hypothetical protein